VDSAGNIFVTDCWNGLVRKVTPQGVVTTLRDAAGSPIEFKLPCGIALSDPQGSSLIVAEYLAHKITKIMPL